MNLQLIIIVWQNDDNSGKIDLNEIPAIKPLIDRTDLLFVFKKPKDESAIREYTYKKSKLEDQHLYAKEMND
jgi:hypothetical protein